jgi:hypothetical protein
MVVSQDVILPSSGSAESLTCGQIVLHPGNSDSFSKRSVVGQRNLYYLRYIPGLYAKINHHGDYLGAHVCLRHSAGKEKNNPLCSVVPFVVKSLLFQLSLSIK